MTMMMMMMMMTILQTAMTRIKPLKRKSRKMRRSSSKMLDLVQTPRKNIQFTLVLILHLFRTQWFLPLLRLVKEKNPELDSEDEQPLASLVSSARKRYS